MTPTYTREYTRRGITFTVADPIQPIIDDLLSSYCNALDLTSIVKIALIEHWRNKRTNQHPVRDMTPQEKLAVSLSEQDEIVDYSTAKIELAKSGIQI